MKTLCVVFGLLLLSRPLVAQNDYVAYTATASSPGQYKTLVGDSVGSGGLTGTSTIFLSRRAGKTTTSGYNNAFVGTYAGQANTPGNGNIFLGKNAGQANTSGNYNAFVGVNAGFANTSGVQNTFLGYQTGYNNTAGSNTFLGYQAGYANTTGQANVFIGALAGYSNTTGTGNMFLGQQAGANSTGSYNLFMGNSAGSGTTSGTGNTAIGDGSMLSNTTGQNNTSIGRYAGINLTTGSNNTFIGVAAAVPSGSGALTNATAIGYNASVTASNALILGSGVNVGIGNTAPNNKLEISQGSAGNSGLRFTNLTSGTTPSVSTNQFLTVNASGDVVLALVGGSKGAFRTAAVDSSVAAGWSLVGTILQNTNSGGVLIGSGITQTPAGYQLYVAQGILTEKVKVAVKNSSDWSDKVFDAGYSLRGLSEVEAYIHTHKHLPGVPSAAEVVETGVDVARMDAKLLEKIEELTLYSIQLEKANRELKQQQQQDKQQQQARLDQLERLVKHLLKHK